MLALTGICMKPPTQVFWKYFGSDKFEAAAIHKILLHRHGNGLTVDIVNMMMSSISRIPYP